jgi:hypothetical protein
MTDMPFPKGFETLAHLAPEWVLRDNLERQRKRAASTIAEVKAFFDAVFPEIDRIMAYLNTLPMDALSPADKNLYRLAATWMEMSHPIDLNWRETDEPGIFPFERVQFIEPSPAD